MWEALLCSCLVVVRGLVMKLSSWESSDCMTRVVTTLCSAWVLGSFRIRSRSDADRLAGNWLVGTVRPTLTLTISVVSLLCLGSGITLARTLFSPWFR